MLDLFLNPGYLAAGGALVSAPIIIHLINRMRFKRLRWAAMEFLLKSQKRNRRRLIIEQLILLMLRCFLVILAALLVLRFVGFSLASFTGQDTLHVVLLDDSPSMGDQWKEGNERKTCFKVAKDDVILGGIVKSLGQSSTNERLAIIPLSKLVTEDDFQPTVFQRLNDASTEKAVKAYLEELQVTNLRVDMLQGVKLAKALFGDHPEAKRVLHLVSDFRQVDWNGPEAEGLLKALRALHDDKVKIRPTDTAHPYRAKGQGGVPRSHDNLAIIDLRANTRIVGKGMPVTFKVTVANYGGRDESVNIVLYDDDTGKEKVEADVNPPMPLRVSPDSTASATFEMRPYPDIKPGDKLFALRVSARLESAQRTPLENDGLAVDNVRHAAVEIRNKVPVLVIDGDGKRGREQNGDSFFIERAIASVPGGSYEVIYGDELAGGNAPKALERTDLLQYPTIFLLNVRELSARQQRNLEHYVAEGGGVAFFLGPNVSAPAYTRDLYKNGQGVFPVPLRTTFFPPPNEELRKTPYTGDFQLRVRDDQFGGTAEGLRQVPILGEVFRQKSLLDFLKDLPIRRYFQVPRSEWTVEPGKVFELATLPNDNVVTAYQAATLALMERLPLQDEAYKPYWPGLKRHADAIRAIVAPGSEQKAYKLADELDNLLTDKGKDDKSADYPNLTSFWYDPNPKISSLRDDVKALSDLVKYGDPFVVAQRYGKGRVVAVMTTAGKEWTDWPGGCEASVVFQPFIWEMQNWLSSQSADSDLTVGTPIKIEVDSARWKQEGKLKLKTVRTFYKAKSGEASVKQPEAPNFGSEAGGVLTFAYPKTFEPGYYLTQLFTADDADMHTALAAWDHTYNVDARREGKLRRVSQDDFERSLGLQGIPIEPPPQGQVEELVNRQSDLSETAWFFILFLAILVAEQALAVHLSFHLKGAEAELPSQAAHPHSQAA
jgi:hypothetical protein